MQGETAKQFSVRNVSIKIEQQETSFIKERK